MLNYVTIELIDDTGMRGRASADNWLDAATLAEELEAEGYTIVAMEKETDYDA